jgi:hypothetical protein
VSALALLVASTVVAAPARVQVAADEFRLTLSRP